ncbi:cytochrome P450 [Mycena pura]|uniref:Cytochrome P450 n=1 Tax=Mycena pura TaxID=153505 RepID=A0AAD6UZV3_9AGAR|nr:cytochrome P450 [Mycena pura]
MYDLDIRALLLYALAAAVAIRWFQSREESTIPAIPGSKGLLYYVAALRFLRNGFDVVNQGYYQHRNGVFRVPGLFRWEYIANGPQHTAEMAAAPDDSLSFMEALRDILAVDYTNGIETFDNPFHIVTIRRHLTQNIARCFPQVRDELVHAFDDVLALDDKEWKLLHVVPNVMKIVARTSNRLFVGLPLCREQEFLDICVDFAVKSFTRGVIIGFLPYFLRPIFGPLLSTRKSSVRRALKFLGPMINDRLDNEREYGPDWPDKPNDLTSWLLEVAEGEGRTPPGLTLRILLTNQAAIHTTTMTLTAVLYDLTAYPAHILPMREEAERVVAVEGWTKAALGSMHKIDSFIRESQRLRGNGPVSLGRKVVAKDGFLFSDGTRIPYGALLTVAATTHYDPDNFADPDVFDGFRFSRMREQYGPAHEHEDDKNSEASIFNRHMVSTAREHLVFGHGRHACPGRFFAATELKAMLAHILIEYDVRAETEGLRPLDECIGLLRTPSREGRIWVRRRERGSEGL